MKKLMSLVGAAMAAVFAVSTTVAAGAELPTLTVELREVDDVRLFDGVVEAVNRSTVSAQTSGRIVEIDFDVNDLVKSGEVIVRFADGEHKARLAQTESALNVAIANRTGAEEDFKRIEKLFKGGTVARARFDNSKTAFDAAKGHVETAKAAVAQAREQLEYTIVRAPYGGIVVKRHVQIGETANPGQPLMTRFSLEELRVNVAVPQQYADGIKREKQASVHLGNSPAIKAESLTVFPFADARSHTVTIRVLLPQGNEQVFPGMLVKVAFNVGKHRMLLVPGSATIKRGEVAGIYLKSGKGKPYLQQIRTGRTVGDHVEVVSGLSQGDEIITDPLKATMALKSKTDETK